MMMKTRDFAQRELRRRSGNENMLSKNLPFPKKTGDGQRNFRVTLCLILWKMIRGVYINVLAADWKN